MKKHHYIIFYVYAHGAGWVDVSISGSIDNVSTVKEIENEIKKLLIREISA